MPTALKRQKKAAGAVRPVEGLIHVSHDQKVMLDSDLAALYEVSTSALNQAVRRNIERFPADFMFQLSEAEAECLISQSVISNTGRGGRRSPPFVFTEHGVAMLSTVLRSGRAIQMGIAIVRAFIHMREMIASNKDLASRVENLENKQDRTASVIEILVEDIDRLALALEDAKELPTTPKRRIGFVSASA